MGATHHRAARRRLSDLWPRGSCVVRLRLGSVYRLQTDLKAGVRHTRAKVVRRWGGVVLVMVVMRWYGGAVVRWCGGSGVEVAARWRRGEVIRW